MSIVKQFVLECDLFAHGTLQRYKQQEGYRTLVGGIISIIIVILFIAVFFSLVLKTFNMDIINSQSSTNYEDDPSYTELTADPSKNYMFAIGIAGMDLSSSQRYFDIQLVNRTTIKNGSSANKTIKNIPLSPCKIDQWSGVTKGISDSYALQNFSQWLCPPLGTVMPLQGKFTSTVFKYVQLTINACTNNSLFPNTTCKSNQQFIDFESNNGQFVVSIYFINPVINAGEKNFVSYYLQDTNYFYFDSFSGISANLYYNDYKIITDNSIMPWIQNTQINGMQMISAAVGQNYPISSAINKQQYFKFYWRKASGKVQIKRTFQKLDQTLSYIGGLFGTIILLLIFLKFYSKYAYQLDIAEKIYKEDNGGSFGSENFNFIVFLGYAIFNIFSKLGVILDWKTMKKYHRCRQECQKQLNIDLFMKKLSYFQEIAQIVLEDHHLKVLHMVPKPTIKEAKLIRKTYLMKSIIYHQLERKGKDYTIEEQQYRQRYLNFLKGESEGRYKDQREIQGKQDEFQALREDFASCYKKTHRQSQNQHAKKIIHRLEVKSMVKSMMQYITSQNFRKSLKATLTNKREPLVLELLPLPTNKTKQQLMTTQNRMNGKPIDSSNVMVFIDESDGKLKETP